MKNSKTILLPVLTLTFIILMSFTYSDSDIKYAPIAGDKFEIPTDIQEIFDKSCFGCHNVDAQNDKSKKKLLIDELSALSESKLVAKLDAIAEAVGENEMPPEKFLTKYPDKKLTDAEAKKLKEWAENAAEELMK